MIVTALTLDGLSDLPAFSTAGAGDLGPVVRVRGPSPAATALGDGLELAFAAFSPARLQRLLRRWELLAPHELPEITGELLPDQASWTDREAARGLVASPESRSITVKIEIALDPLMFGTLRGLAAREPRLVTALSRGGRAQVSVGALFATSYDALAISIQEVSFGGESFPTTSGQRPPWLGRFLESLAHRLARHPEPGLDLADFAMDAATAREGHANYARWTGSLAPQIRALRPARGPGDAPILLADERPLRRFGEAAQRRAAESATAWLSDADLLWLECEDRWPEDCVAGDSSPLEQVWRVCAEGTLDPQSETSAGNVLMARPPRTDP